jgi:low affinity Fe/Cu permease
MSGGVCGRDRLSRRLRGGEMTGSDDAGEGRLDRAFRTFSTLVARWTGSHWTFAIVAVLVTLSPVFMGVEATNIAISIVTLLMVFVLQNTQNRDSAALHLKLDEIVRVEPEARDDIRGAELRSEQEIHDLSTGERGSIDDAGPAQGGGRHGSS